MNIITKIENNEIIKQDFDILKNNSDIVHCCYVCESVIEYKFNPDLVEDFDRLEDDDYAPCININNNDYFLSEIMKFDKSSDLDYFDGYIGVTNTISYVVKIADDVMYVYAI